MSIKMATTVLAAVSALLWTGAARAADIIDTIAAITILVPILLPIGGRHGRHSQRQGAVHRFCADR